MYEEAKETYAKEVIEGLLLEVGAIKGDLENGRRVTRHVLDWDISRKGKERRKDLPLSMGCL